MSEELERNYFTWLCAKVEDSRIAPYKRLLKKLHSTEFVWQMSVIGDENRAEDGRELRREFILVWDIPDHPEWRAETPSVLEVLIAFSRRAEFLTDLPAKGWFWEFIDNLGLKGDRPVEDILDQFIWRTYEYSGHGGGLFPLDNPKSDQRDIQLWFQFCDYLVDQDRLP